MNRDEHLAFCKQRAMEYASNGNLADAVASMISDLQKHEETAKFSATIAMLGTLYVLREDRRGVVNWIKGFR